MRKRIPLDQITRNPDQPRQFFDATKLRELADSIRERGLMQPITVRKLEPGCYMITAGERRYRAHQLLAEDGFLGKNPTILCEVVTIDDDEMALQAILENLQRDGIKPLEEARAFQSMLDRGWTVAQLAKDLGISQPWRITDRTVLLNLDESIQTLVNADQFPVLSAYDLVKLPKHEQVKIVQAYAKGQIKGTAGVRAAAQAVLDRIDQPGMFGDGDGKPAPTKDDLEALSRMERMVEKIVSAIASGFKDGEFVAIKTVDPNRADKLADTVAAATRTLRSMEGQLRAAHARSTLM